jgi:hypothetical protein
MEWIRLFRVESIRGLGQCVGRRLQRHRACKGVGHRDGKRHLDPGMDGCGTAGLQNVVEVGLVALPFRPGRGNVDVDAQRLPIG